MPENESDDGIIRTSPKNGEKKRIFRIFCELLAKMGLGSRINRGVPEGYRRNGESPKKGIDTCLSSHNYLPPLFVEMEKALQ